MSTGYGNPPKNTQFKKGRSGNPKGPPRRTVRQVSIGYQFRKVAAEKFSVEDNGTGYRISRWDAYLRQVYAMR